MLINASTLRELNDDEMVFVSGGDGEGEIEGPLITVTARIHMSNQLSSDSSGGGSSGWGTLSILSWGNQPQLPYNMGWAEDAGVTIDGEVQPGDIIVTASLSQADVDSLNAQASAAAKITSIGAAMLAAHLTQGASRIVVTGAAGASASVSEISDTLETFWYNYYGSLEFSPNFNPVPYSGTGPHEPRMPD